MELEKLHASLGRLEEYRDYIGKASSQKGKFPLSVVQKVILNYELRIEVELESSRPIIVAIKDRCTSLEEQLASLRAHSEAPEEMQEIELMYTIGAIGEEDYQRQKREIEQNMVVGDETGLQQELDQLAVYLHRWVGVQGETEVVPLPPKRQQEIVEEPQEIVEESQESVEESQESVEELPVEDDIPPPPPLPDRPIEPIEVEDDSISEVQSFPEPAHELVIEESFIEHETFLVDEEPELGDQLIQDTFMEEESDFGSLGEELPLELEEEPAPDLDIMPDAFELHNSYEDAPVSNDIRSAILLKNEGTPNEEVHTFSGEQYSIGRHQDNNIQIKGDTKVSRRHCKLFRRNGHFYIEDQHSSNGTLVNGELISERRLYGGEELKIGETVYRFRLQ